jgi:hypothetical protein
MLSWLARTAPATVALGIAAILSGIYWLPVLAAMYVVGSGVEAVLSHFKLRLFEDELDSLLRARSQPTPQRLIRPTTAVLSLLWQWLWGHVCRVFDRPARCVLRWHDKHYHERIGQHRWDRFSKFEITGSSNQKQQRTERDQARQAAARAREWLLTNTVDPVVTDGDIHTWIGTAAVDNAT